jgi:hypothetical protein
MAHSRHSRALRVLLTGLLTLLATATTTPVGADPAAPSQRVRVCQRVGACERSAGSVVLLRSCTQHRPSHHHRLSDTAAHPPPTQNAAVRPDTQQRTELLARRASSNDGVVRFSSADWEQFAVTPGRDYHLVFFVNAEYLADNANMQLPALRKEFGVMAQVCVCAVCCCAVLCGAVRCVPRHPC